MCARRLATTRTCREAFGSGATFASVNPHGLVCLVDVVTESTIRPVYLNTLCGKFSWGNVARFEDIAGETTWRCYLS